MRYIVFARNSVGTYSHIVIADNEMEAIRKARPILMEMAFRKRGLRFSATPDR